MHIYRLSLTIFAKELTGMGSFLFGGRWNKVGTSCLYASESRALSALELLVNDTVGKDIPDDFSLVTIAVPDKGHLVLVPKQLPPDWNNTESPESTQLFGTALLEKAEHLIIRIPSVVTPEEYNYIVNPAHPDMKKVRVEHVAPFAFDTRLKR